MSGQYPPPNPAHPFSRTPHHQRTPPSQSLLPPWSHNPQPAGMNVVGSSMSYYGSPHMVQNRGGQPWIPLQAHPKPLDARPGSTNPLFALPMLMSPEGGQRIPSEYHQEETIDLSSHSSMSPTIQDTPKIMSVRPDSNEMLRNGTILPPEVNGDVDRTSVIETEVKDRVVTSVIAANPLRESISDSLNYSKVSENSVVKRAETSVLTENLVRSVESFTNPQLITCVKSDSDIVDGKVTEPVNRLVSSVLKTTSSIEPVVKSESLDFDRLDDSSTHDVIEKTELKSTRSSNTLDTTVDDLENIEHPSRLNESPSHFDNSLLSKDVYNSKLVVDTDDCKLVDDIDDSKLVVDLDDSKLSVDTDESKLVVDTDDSKLVVADSSGEDIFGTSPVHNSTDLTSQEESEKSEESSEAPLVITEIVPNKTSETVLVSTSDESLFTKSTPIAPAVSNSEPHPSVENVEILLENMFNSQEETSCSSQNSNSGVPKSVIVSSGPRTLADISRPQVDIITPMKEEELAMTLAEDNPIEAEFKENNKENYTDDIDEIEKKLEILTESSSTEFSKSESQLQKESSNPESIKEDPDSCQENERVNIESTLMSIKPEVSKEENQLELTKNLVSSPPKTEASSTNNPFIEVETELEKMFAGIVEPSGEVVSDNIALPSVSEPKRPVVNKRPITKRKKANSRRSSDYSVFGGSSGDSMPLKKKGRKRLNDSGSERGSKKMKIDSAENFKKGKVAKDVTSDCLNSKVKGPFVHIEGSKESPASVVIVNSGVRPDDDDGADKANTRRKHSTLQRSEVVSRKAGPAYSSSTLSMRYNSDTADLSWVCVFCKRGPHCVGGLGGEPAGDLFGPYRIPATWLRDEAVPLGTPLDRDIVEEQKRRGGKHPKSLRASGAAEHFMHKIAKKSKRSMSSDTVEPQSGLLPVEGGYEVWLHELCAAWAPGLCIIDVQLVGLNEAVWTALRTKCSQCGEYGAGIGCVVRNCPARTHYHCAELCGWWLDTDTFIARCQMHRTRLRSS